MGLGLITVETERLDQVAGQVEGYADDYLKAYNELFTIVKDMKEAWDGKDNVAYTNQIEGFRNDFQKMEQLMRDYAEYLRKCAKTYRDTQENIARSAGSLSQGN